MSLQQTDPKLHQILVKTLEYMREVAIAVRTGSMEQLEFIESQNVNVNLRVDIRDYVG